MPSPSRSIAAAPATGSAAGVAPRTGGYRMHLLMVLSGFAGLGYEMVWTRAVSVALGHEVVAVLAVVAAFFTGLAIGAWALDGRIRGSAVPGRWYAALEVLIGCWALALVVLIPVFNDAMVAAIGTEPAPSRHWAAVFLGTLLLFLPATVAMGATLPAMERLFTGRERTRWGVAGLYAANTLGAVLGTLVTTIAIVPLVGATSALMLLATVNFVCACGVLALDGGRPVADVPVEPSGAPAGPRLAALLAVTGLVGIGYEVVVIRVLSQVLENTVYTFAALLAVYLLGTAAGAALYDRYAPRGDFHGPLALLLKALSLACLAGTALLWLAAPGHAVLTVLLGNGYFAAIAGEFILGSAIFFLPALLMGATFSHLAQAARESFGLGRALGINTLGGAAAPFVFGIVLLPVVGSKLLLVAIAAVYLLLVPYRADRHGALAAVPAAAALGIALVAGPLRVVDVPQGGEILSYDEGVMASVSVVSDAAGRRFLKVNNHFTMGSSASRFSDRRQAHIPLLLHPEPHTALFLGLGTGSTFAAAAAHPKLDATGVELIPEILPALGYFGPTADAIRGDERFRLVTSDARRFVRSSPERYDVVIGEVFHPSRDGSGSLYTVEHFEAIRARLNDEGLFCQWLPLFQLDLETLQTIVRTFVHVFPDAEAHLAHFSLGQPIVAIVGRKSPHRYHRGWLRDRVRSRALAEDLASVGLETDFALFGGFLAGADGLRRFAGSGALNTDDRPVVTYQAPGFVYAAPEPAWVRLLALLDRVDADAGDLIGTVGDTDNFHSRIEAYWDARDAYLAAGVDIAPHDDVHVMLDQLRAPLLTIAGISSDFIPAYRPLVELAFELNRVDPVAARELLDDIISTAPDRPEARTLRDRLFGT